VSAATYRRERTRRGVDGILLILLAGAAGCLPMAIHASEWVPEASRLGYVSLWALLTGVVLGRSRLPPGVSTFLGVLLGLEYAIQYAAKLLPRLSLVLGDASRAGAWVWELARYQRVSSPAPFERSALFVSQRLAEAFRNVASWATAAQSGAAARDNTVLWLLASAGVWLVTWYAAYELFRTHRAFLALLPLGVAVVANVSLTYLGLGFVHSFLALMLLILVAANVERMQVSWARSGLDFSSELRRDTLLAGAGVSGLVLVVALLMPYVTYNRAVWFFWDRVGPTLTRFYDRLDDAFAGRNPLPTATPNPKDLLPHEVRSGATPQENVVMTVAVSEPPPPTPEEIENLLGHGDASMIYIPPKHYWRERAYDVYTGHGWDSGERESARYPAGASWDEPLYPHTVLTQTYAFVDKAGTLSYAVNEPVTVVGQGYEVVTLGGGDLAALAVGARNYTVVSYVPSGAAPQLRAAEGEYPAWVSDRYLSLPSIPDRVRAKAQEVVAAAGAETRYDKARALEAYLRSFTYDLSVEPPSLDQDVVDYFLFSAQRGYCDYSASAMVVMLRSAGVAARYASGYGMGTFNFDDDVYVVTGKNAHAWSEVYFPGYGWIEFEPTPTERIFEYVGDDASGDAALDPEASAGGTSSLAIPIWAWGLGLLAIVAFVIVWPPRYLASRRTDPTRSVRQTYARLVRAARWAGAEPSDGQTPSEYLQHLGHEVEQRVGAAIDAREPLGTIALAYEAARYGVAPVTAQDSYRVEAAGRRLRPTMLRLALSRPRSAPGSASDGVTEPASGE
jgi:hypothetical protein